MLQKTPEMHEQNRLSGQFDSCLFFIMQYFLINKGISVTCDIKKEKKKEKKKKRKKSLASLTILV